MDAARRANQSAKMKQRWAENEVVAARLGVSKLAVNDRRPELENRGIWARLIAETVHPDAIADAKEFFAEAPVRAYEPDAHEEVDDNGLLRIALWFIGKCGSVETAERALSAAKKAKQELAKRR